MEFFRIKRSIPFMRYALIFNVISLITFLIAVGALATRGLHLGVDFTGGTVIEVTYKQAPDALTAACEITHVYGRAEALDVIARSRADYMARYAHLAEMLQAFLSTPHSGAYPRPPKPTSGI